MPRSPGQHERLIAVFLLAVVAFSPPLLRIFGRGADLFGLPLLYVYVFVAWAGVILVLAFHSDGEAR